MHPAIKKAKEALTTPKRKGTIKRLAKLLGVSRAAVYSWKIIPHRQAVMIENVTKGKVSRAECRPDLWEK